MERPSLRQDVLIPFKRGFLVFVDSARFMLHMRPLRRLAIAGAIVQIVWIGLVLLLVEVLFEGPLVVLGIRAPSSVQGLLGFFGVCLALLCFPVIGPVAAAMQMRVAEHIRAFAKNESSPWPGAKNWLLVIVLQMPYFFRRLFIFGAVASGVAIIVGVMVPGGPSPLQLVVQAASVLAVLAVDTLISLDRSRWTVLELVRGHWPDIAGYIVGLWCVSMFGLVPWLAPLLPIAAENLLRGMSRPDVRRKMLREPAAPSQGKFVRVDPRVADRIRTRYQRLGEEDIAWTYSAPDTTNTRFEAIWLASDRLGHQHVVALAPTDRWGRVHAHSAREFWLMATRHAGEFRYSDLHRIGERFAGPFPID